MRVFVLDNYDSFTYNLVQYLGELGCDVMVRRNDETTPRQVAELQPDRVIISPGPGRPAEAGITLELVRHLAGRIPLMGVCLGHQCIGEAFGGAVVRAPEIRHGKTSLIHHQGDSIFTGLPNPFEATRYHSLIVRRDNLPSCLKVQAWTHDGLIMGLEHRDHPIFGVQFHPESILTTVGKSILENFLCCRNSLGN